MRKLLFAVRDVKAEAFTMNPITVLMRGEAVRGFSDQVNDPKTPWGQSPQDYQLYELGHFDCLTGQLVPREGGPLDLGSGLQYLESRLKLEKEA